MDHLSRITNDLFLAYRQANELTQSRAWTHVADFFGKVTSDSDMAQLRREAYDSFLKSIDPKDIEATILAINTYFTLVSTAQEIRRQDVQRSLERNMQNAIEENKGNTVDNPLPVDAHVPGGWSDILFYRVDPRSGETLPPRINSPRELIAYINETTPEKILTQHPTNANSVQLNRVVAEMVAAGLEVTQPVGTDPNVIAQKFTQSLQRFAKTDRSPSGSFTVNDEIEQGLNAVGHAQNGIQESYRSLVTLARGRFGDAFTPEHEIELAKNFHVIIGDWAASDKDGNDNVRAEHRLKKLAQQRLAAATHYQKVLADLAENGCPASFIAERQQEIEGLIGRLQKICADIDAHKKDDGDIPLSVEQFDDYSDSLSRAFDYVEWPRALAVQAETAFRALTDEERADYGTALSGLINTVENYGFRGCHNEYRENCGFYDDVWNVLCEEMLRLEDDELTLPKGITAEAFRKRLGAYAMAGEEEQASIVNDIIMWGLDDEQIKQRANSPLRIATKKIHDEAKVWCETDRDYKSDRVKAYHTLRSLMLAQDHSDCFEHLTLAETKKPVSLMIATALQHAAHTTRPPKWLSVIPLFEDPDSLRKYLNILEVALKRDAFKKLVVDLEGKQQIMFGHSDGWRLSGRIATVGLLGLARGLDHLKSLAERIVVFGEKIVRLVIKVYEGFSLTDRSRGGGRDTISTIVDTITALHHKNLIQGVDLPNFVNSAVSFARMITKEMVRSVKVHSSTDPVCTETRDINRMVCDVAASTTDAYRSRHLKGTMMDMLAHPLFNYILTGIFANISSRAATRGGLKGNPWNKKPDPVNVQPTRAIGVSTTLSYANIVNNWMCADLFEKGLVERLQNNEVFRDILNRQIPEDVTDRELVRDGQLTAHAARVLYKVSPEYRMIVDNLAQSVALTDWKTNEFRRAYALERGIQGRYVTEDQQLGMYGEYCSAARLAALSMGPVEQDLPSGDPSSETCGAWHNHVEKKIVPMQDRDFLTRLQLLGFAIHDQLICDTMNKGGGEPQCDDAPIIRMLRVLHNGMNRLINPKIDSSDIPLAETVQKGIGSVRPHNAVFAETVSMALAA